jgi:hypothetical protein
VPQEHLTDTHRSWSAKESHAISCAINQTKHNEHIKVVSSKIIV